jgi:glycosyltransferase involved in cell wall biosynthesis
VCGAIAASALRGCATVVKICSEGAGGDIAKLRRDPLGRLVWPLIRRRAAFVVPTPSLVPVLVAAGVPLPRIVSIPNAIGRTVPAPPLPLARSEARAELGLPDRPTALFVGRLSPEKGPDVLMRAWDQVPRCCDATLVVVGDGPEGRRVADWAAGAGREKHVRLMGVRLDVARFYQAADVLTVASHTETFCNVLAEGMSHGLAVVTTPVGLARHFIRDGENGLIACGEDGSEMAHALHRLLSDPGLRDRLGAAARREALPSFSADSVVERHLDLYDQLMTPTPEV